MSAELIELSGSFLMILVSGKLSHAELKEVQAQSSAAIRKHGQVRILVVAEDFQGWEKGGDWGDLSFDVEHDSHVEAMAIVGDPKWKEPVLFFTAQGLREFPIAYFDHGQMAQARAWLRAQ